MRIRYLVSEDKKRVLLTAINKYNIPITYEIYNKKTLIGPKRIKVHISTPTWYDNKTYFYTVKGEINTYYTKHTNKTLERYYPEIFNEINQKLKFLSS